jgi:SAM-dependent MidA family methyltransferase
MKPSIQPPCAPEVLEALRRRAKGAPAVGFADFMEVALYDPAAGYYRKDRPRIGYGAGTDFLTATASSPLFGRLVVAACEHLLGVGASGDYAFVELGAERGSGVLAGHAHPFRSARTVGVGEELRIEGPSIVFSNEIFDAQPFRRFIHRDGAWRESGVSVDTPELREVELSAPEPLPVVLPAGASEGYRIDAPLAAAELAATLCAQPWSGLFLAFDYGKSWEEIAFGTPEGTARSYRRHVQGNDLLAAPGDQDLTCHVCWDWIAHKLVEGGFWPPTLESQEAFFTRHAGAFIEAFTASEAGRVSRDKLSLLHLLHPAHMGQKFQALWALRPAPAPGARSSNPLASGSPRPVTSSF